MRAPIYVLIHRAAHPNPPTPCSEHAANLNSDSATPAPSSADLVLEACASRNITRLNTLLVADTALPANTVEPPTATARASVWREGLKIVASDTESLWGCVHACACACVCVHV